MIRVGINARTFSVDEPGGAVQAGINVTKEIISDESVEVVLFGHESVSSLFPDTPVDSSIYHRDSQLYGLLWERTAIPYLVKKHELDVLYCPNGNGPFHRVSCPVVMSIMDVNAQKGMSSGVHQLYRKLAVPPAARAANHIITISNFSKREIENSLDLPSSKIRVVYPGLKSVYLDDVSAVKCDLPEEYILYVGALNPRKNVSGLIRAYQRLKNEIPHKLVLIGPGNQAIFKNLDVEESDDIIRPGYLSERELKFAYANADAFVFPSHYEGFGLPPLEAMACGTPVVASRATALPEVLGNAAELVDSTSTDSIAEGITRVLADSEYSELLVEKGRERAMLYTWEKAGRQTLAVLKAAQNK
ncbi:glycosyltransferase family 4 protein [Halegenticoccus tardaugens]|uniref:glycosyltransferase family 4 protein n=1 Tax=Halegenticoccus tardaugens TaxID=2071624 RepID=UPI00100B2EFD|nr:glycosyltransferase family 1 protein [Halegenticoccus tardaugens]